MTVQSSLRVSSAKLSPCRRHNGLWATRITITAAQTACDLNFCQGSWEFVAIFRVSREDRELVQKLKDQFDAELGLVCTVVDLERIHQEGCPSEIRCLYSWLLDTRVILFLKFNLTAVVIRVCSLFPLSQFWQRFWLKIIYVILSNCEAKVSNFYFHAKLVVSILLRRYCGVCKKLKRMLLNNFSFSSKPWYFRYYFFF